MTQFLALASPKTWDRVAEGYASEFLPLFSLYAQDALAKANLSAEAEVLDVAAGPGTLALMAAKYVRRVVAIDFAQDMINILNRKAAAAGYTNVHAQLGDGQALPLEDCQFDAAFSMFGLIFFPDRHAGFTELRRVLKPGGRAVVSSWAPVGEVPLLSALYNYLSELSPGLSLTRAGAALSEPSEIQCEMEAVGFHSVTVETVVHKVEVPSLNVFWQSQVAASAPIGLIRRRSTEQEWDELSQSIVSRLIAEFGSGPLTYSCPAHLGLGVR